MWRTVALFAHSPSDMGHEDPVRVHLQRVAERAAEYATAFGQEHEAYIAGLLHDLGKYGKLFQQRLEGKAHHVDHWSAGAWAALTKYHDPGIVATVLAIQGHHVGLQEASKDALKGLNPAKLREQHPQSLRLSEPDLEQLLALFAADGLKLPDTFPGSAYEGLSLESPAAKMLDVRMLFSALVDADFVETEAHFQAAGPDGPTYRPSGPGLEPERALPTLLSYADRLQRQATAAPEVNGLRADLLAACLAAGELPQGLFTLTAPTGTGKTLSMLALALKHAAQHGLRRVVMVIPYLTIIEQTARAYRDALAELGGPDLVDRYVLEDHSLVQEGASGRDQSCTDQDNENEYLRQTRLLAENWDAPLIITTSVRFLESLFANRSARCRKLHRLAKSVILFDEVQTLPLRLAVPTLATLSRLGERYGTSIVFATATQPAFGHLDEHVQRFGHAGWQPREIVPAALELFDRARRTAVIWPEDTMQSVSWDEIADEVTEESRILCVVNLKRHARILVERLYERGLDGLSHLSTSMCPVHRGVVLDAVRRRLEAGEPCRLISTQCVEAGVDVDFPVVIRAWGPLDAIAQAAGRCNRNGRAELGSVRVFVPEPEEGRQIYPDGAYQQAASVATILLRDLSSEDMDIHDPELFSRYYRELYSLKDLADSNDELTGAIRMQDFVEVARLYRVIKQDAINVVVPYDLKVHADLAQRARESGLTREWITAARPHTVGMYRPKRGDAVWTYLEPVPVGRRRESSDEWFIYLGEDHYDHLMGLVPVELMHCLIG